MTFLQHPDLVAAVVAVVAVVVIVVVVVVVVIAVAELFARLGLPGTSCWSARIRDMSC